MMFLNKAQQKQSATQRWKNDQALLDTKYRDCMEGVASSLWHDVIFSLKWVPSNGRTGF